MATITHTVESRAYDHIFGAHTPACAVFCAAAAAAAGHRCRASRARGTSLRPRGRDVMRRGRAVVKGCVLPRASQWSNSHARVSLARFRCCVGAVCVPVADPTYATSGPADFYKGTRNQAVVRWRERRLVPPRYSASCCWAAGGCSPLT